MRKIADLDAIHVQHRLIFVEKCNLRLRVLVSAFVLLIVSVFCEGFWGNWLLGVSGSLLVWSLVESISFLIDTKQTVLDQRSRFFSLTQEAFELMISTYKPELVDGKFLSSEFKKFQESIVKLYADVMKFPFEGPLYANTEEFQKAVNYIERMYWKYDSIQLKSSEEFKIGDLVLTDVYKGSYEDLVLEWKEIEATRQATSNLAKCDLNFDKLDIPEGLVHYDWTGYISYWHDLSGRRFIKRFKPSSDFNKEIYSRSWTNRSIFAIAKELYQGTSHPKSALLRHRTNG